MNLLLSLVLLNPLEALVIILGCDIFTKRKFNIKKDIKHCYILGTINLLIQMILSEFNCFLGLFLNIFTMFIIAPIIIKIYYNKVYKINIKYFECFIVQSIYMFLSFFIIGIINNSLNNIYILHFNNIFDFFLSNIIIKIVQLVILFIIKLFLRKVIHNEKHA